MFESCRAHLGSSLLISHFYRGALDRGQRLVPH
jgi:hypothetical protein